MDDTGKTKAQLIAELARLRRQVAALEPVDSERDRLEEALRVRSHELGERVKELHCLYGISALVEESQASLPESHT